MKRFYNLQEGDCIYCLDLRDGKISRLVLESSWYKVAEKYPGYERCNLGDGRTARISREDFYDRPWSPDFESHVIWFTDLGVYKLLITEALEKILPGKYKACQETLDRLVIRDL